jgi:hypothetical protein
MVLFNHSIVPSVESIIHDNDFVIRDEFHIEA